MRTSFGNVSTKGQITIPTEIRKELGIQPGDTVQITVEDNKIVLRPTDMSLRAGYMSIPALKKPLTDDEINELIALDAVEDFKRSTSHKD